MLRLDVLVREALEEDIGQGDVTTNATVPEDARCQARLVAKQEGVLTPGTIVSMTGFGSGFTWASAAVRW